MEDKQGMCVLERMHLYSHLSFHQKINGRPLSGQRGGLNVADGRVADEVDVMMQ